MKRSGLPKRKAPLRATGRKATRERKALDAFKAAVHARRWCEAQGLLRGEGYLRGKQVCSASLHIGEHAHHVWPEDRRTGKHDPDRGLLLCYVAHSYAHDFPADAKRLGLLRPEG
jgi:hypothetical protein